MEENKMVHINIKVCCNNMIYAIKSKIILINEGEFCLGNSVYLLKEPTKKYDSAIVKLFFCPWCGQKLEKIVDDIRQKIKEGEQLNVGNYN